MAAAGQDEDFTLLQQLSLSALILGASVGDRRRFAAAPAGRLLDDKDGVQNKLAGLLQGRLRPVFQALAKLISRFTEDPANANASAMIDKNSMKNAPRDKPGGMPLKFLQTPLSPLPSPARGEGKSGRVNGTEASGSGFLLERVQGGVVVGVGRDVNHVDAITNSALNS